MTRFCYVNGRYVRHPAACVHVEDRGYQFADGVYEVCEIRNGRLIDERRHMQRLSRSLSELRIPAPMSAGSMGAVLREVVRRNRIDHGMIYVQVTRGVAPRQHAFPATPPAPSLVVTARRSNRRALESAAAQGVAVVSVSDIRWQRVDIKSVGLLANVLAKQKAVEAGAAEALFADEEGIVTEGASSNVWMITTTGVLVTHPADHRILRGIARAVVFDLAERHGLTIDERRFTVAELQSAREVFLTSAMQQLTPVVRVDGVPIGSGKPGALTMRLRAAFHDLAEVGAFWSRASGATGSK